MNVQGKLLVASPHLLDPNFYRSVVLVIEHGAQGALGLVLNRPTGERVVDYLEEWSGLEAEPAVVFIGGPVQPDIGVCLEHEPGGSEPWASLVDLEGGPAGIEHQIRVYAGYSGWDEGQLESELEEGGWLVLDPEPADAFSAEPERLWQTVLKRQDGTISWLANFPPDPRLN
jgi:putative transcriptional regulator